MQLFFAFPLFSNNASPQVAFAPKNTPQPSPSLSLSRGSRYLLGTRGFCNIIMGMLIFFNGPDVGHLALLIAVTVLLSAMATLALVAQEWKASRRRRWLLPEGILGSLAGILLITSTSQILAYSLPSNYSPLAWVWVATMILWFLTTGIGEIIASHAWALIVGGILSLLETASILAALIMADSPLASAPIAQPVAYFLFFAYPILFGIALVIAAFQ
ncbi:hypothetical protein [Reticulibacter mediterranei]|nr:hypothetical protein [Reticulibacter mediterranei]